MSMDKTRKNRMTRLSSMLDNMVAPSVRKRGFVLSRLVSEWPIIAGDIATWSRPSRLALMRGAPTPWAVSGHRWSQPS